MSDEQSTELTAGQLLKQGRELRQLSCEQVALQLNLKAGIINKIEQDKLDGQALEPFTRGYLRSYARLLKLPEQQIIDAFERQHGLRQPEIKPMTTFSNQAAREATESRFMWLTYAIAALLIALLIVWWWQTDQQTAIDNPLPVSQAPAITEYGSEVVNTLETQADAEPDAPVVSNSEAEIPAVETSQPESTIAQAAEPVTQSVVAPDNASDANTDSLRMSFQDNCWINVVDAEGNRVAYGTKQKGYVMDLSGVAPFVITLGNPSVVRIELNQKPFDMSAFPAGRVAKFTVDRE